MARSLSPVSCWPRFMETIGLDALNSGVGPSCPGQDEAEEFFLFIHFLLKYLQK